MNMFVSRKPREVPKVEYETIREVYNLIPKAKKIIDADGVEQNVLEYEPILVQKVNIQEYIDSFADEVGIQNILKKVALSGDRSLLNQTGRVPLNKDGGLEPIQDFSNVPSSKTEAFNLVAKGVEAYDNLPADIKGKMSLEQFAQEFGQAQFEAYIKSVIDKYSQKEKEENK